MFNTRMVGLLSEACSAREVPTSLGFPPAPDRATCHGT